MNRLRNGRRLYPLLIAIILLQTVASARATSSVAATPQTCLNYPSLSIPTYTGIKVALVMPVFTATPYTADTASFYTFYRTYGSTKGYVTQNLNWLSTPVSFGFSNWDGYGYSYPLFQFVNSQSMQNCGFTVGHNLFIITDIEVSTGALFNSNGSRRFDSVITGFSEYVTAEEFSQFKQFVGSGGKMVMMGGDNLMAQVTYSPAGGVETYVRGHYWIFNGSAAWQGGGINSWNNDDLNWIGSRYSENRISYSGANVDIRDPIGAALAAQFGSVIFQSYKGHEEGKLINFTGTSIIATLPNILGMKIAAYEHDYRQGKVICICIFADDAILKDLSIQYFLVLALSPILPGINLPPPPDAPCNPAGIITCSGRAAV